MESWIEEEHQHMDWEPVGVVLKSDGESARNEDSQRTVREIVQSHIREEGLSFDEEGLTAGMFAR